ncbi:MAG: TonB-dependent receptor, partial [Gammaproteobacteria bacterium]|nr:TonB-dependent receptor [Gammaproteobacteria bacterium]
EAWSLRANYTFTDSEQLSGPDEGLPLTDTARHMANATLAWQATGRFGMQLVSETRSRRYRDVIDGVRRDYQDYTVLHLGAQYRFSDNVAINARINNLLDEDFTSFQTLWAQDEATGEWAPTNLDDYNNKDKARNLWISLNMQF